jgi:hypothetical protein
MKDVVNEIEFINDIVNTKNVKIEKLNILINKLEQELNESKIDNTNLIKKYSIIDHKNEEYKVDIINKQNIIKEGE